MTYRQANSIGSDENVTPSPTCVHLPPPQSASVVHESVQMPAGTRALSTHQFCTQPFSGQSAPAEHGTLSGRLPQATRNKQSAKSFDMPLSVTASVLLAQARQVISAG